jgi:hypothetical protein
LKEEIELKLLIRVLAMGVICLSLAGCGAASAVPLGQVAANSKPSGPNKQQSVQCTQLPTTTNSKGQRVFSYQCPNYPVFTFTETKKK